MANAHARTERPEDAARHWLVEMPYRMVAFVRVDQNGTPLFQVAGSDAPPAGAEKALKRAFAVHGGTCFYCKAAVASEHLTLDHVEPRAHGGSQSFQNLVIACRPCNRDKGERPIELFRPAAGREWLSALLAQVQERLNRLQD